MFQKKTERYSSEEVSQYLKMKKSTDKRRTSQISKRKADDVILLEMLEKNSNERSPVRSTLRELNAGISGGLSRRLYRIYEEHRKVKQ